MDIVRVAVFALGLGLLVAAVWRRRLAGTFPLATLFGEWFPAPPSKGPVLIAAAAGLASVWAVPLIGWLAGWGRIHPGAEITLRWAGWAALGCAVKMLWALFEELIFRGAIVSELRRSMGPALAVVVSALAFAAAHGGRSPLDRGILFADGIGFALAFVITGGLWVPVVWHAAKNLAVWLVFGRGTIDLAPGPMRFQQNGSGWALGSDGGAGFLELVVTVLVVASATAALKRWHAAKRGISSEGFDIIQ